MIKEQAFELFCEAYGFDNLVPIIMSRLDQDAKLKFFLPKMDELVKQNKEIQKYWENFS